MNRKDRRAANKRPSATGGRAETERLFASAQQQHQAGGLAEAARLYERGDGDARSARGSARPSTACLATAAAFPHWRISSKPRRDACPGNRDRTHDGKRRPVGSTACPDADRRNLRGTRRRQSSERSRSAGVDRAFTARIRGTCHASRGQSGKLADLRKRLAHNRLVMPLFNTRVFTRHIEAAYEAMYQRCQSGLRPEHIDVAAVET